jgi:phosphoribosyl 1,2-cyclic phosphodiesterase
MNSLRITFWGTQGSLPISLPNHAGDTTAIEVQTSEGNIILLDAGSGIRRCSLSIVDRLANQHDRTLHIFGSHEHLDHRLGLTFSRFCYVEQNPFNLHLYGSYNFLHALDQHYGIFSKEISDLTYLDDPVDFTMMSANFTATELAPPSQRSVLGNQHSPHPSRRATDIYKRYWPIHDLSSPIRIGRTIIQPFEVYHVIPCCLGYKIEHDGKTFIFCTDHELRRGPAANSANNDRQQRSDRAESNLRALSQNADLAYMDGQYFLDEYLGKKGIGSFPPMPRLDWGHSCIEDVIARSQQCNIKRTLIGHHDPERDWPERTRMDHHLSQLSANKPHQFQLAHTDLVIDL